MTVNIVTIALLRYWYYYITPGTIQASVASPEMTSSLFQSYPALGLLLYTVPMQGFQQCPDDQPLAPCPLPGTVGSVVCPRDTV